MHVGPMENLLSHLLMARNVAHMWHWKVKSFAQHMALGDLYDGLSTLMDELAEMYMGKYGTEGHVPLSEPNAFSETDVAEFINQLCVLLERGRESIPQDNFIVSKFEELQMLASTTKYKIENLR